MTFPLTRVSPISPFSPKAFRKLLEARLPEMLAVLRRFTVAESPSTEKAPADRCARIVAEAWNQLDTDVELIQQKRRGAHVRVDAWREKSRPAGQLLVLGHYDTVYASGTLKEMPFRVKAGRAHGPGVFDMKAGI